MKKLDILVLKELIGPWIFGVSMFSMLMIAATYLGRIAKFIVDGVPIDKILHITILLLPGILVQTFAMALLLGALLAFGRLSGDSEITAVRASGVSLYRIVAPVAAFSLAVAAVSFFMNEFVAPKATRDSAAIMLDIVKSGQVKAGQPISLPYVQGGKLVAMIGAVNFSVIDSTLQGVHIVAYDKDEHEQYVMFADELYFSGDLKAGTIQSWRIRGQARILSADGSQLIRVNGAWPSQIPQIFTTPGNLLAGQNSDPNVWSMEETQARIKDGRATGSLTPDQIKNLEFAYWNKISLPLAALIFGILGATLGIRNHRTGTATGFAVAIVIIFVYFMLSNFMNVYAMGGIFPPYVASFTPTAIGLLASGVIIWRRNR